MSSSVVPWVKYEVIGDNLGRFVVSPLRRGMGVTLGNAMRRVLLSALGGTAITSMTIDGVSHEFGPIPGVLEDVIDFMCNLRGVVFKGDLKGTKAAKIKFSGPGDVLAKHIEVDAEVEIVNPEFRLARMMESGNLLVNLVLESGFGYRAGVTKAGAGDDPIDVIYMDASFSPVLKVNHEVTRIRVGDELDYESLELDVTTNGSICPEEAVKLASRLLTFQLGLFETLNQPPQSDGNVRRERPKDAVLDLVIDDLELSARSSNCLKRAGIETIGQLLDRPVHELYDIKNFGEKSAAEINEKLAQYGLSLGELTDVAESVGVE